MSGQVVEVLGTSAWFPGGACPDEWKGRTTTLLSADGEKFRVTFEELSLARRTMREATQGGKTGKDSPVTLPFRKGIVAKVLEYLQYHKEYPPSEIRTPLLAGSLMQCGASQWDASYITVEKEVLFELLVAASVMDVPSLLFLAAAQVSTLVKGRSIMGLLKDFNMANDLPREEDAALDSSFSAQQTRRGVIPDVGSFAGVALVLNGILKAADSAGVLSKDGTEPGPTADALKSFRIASWRAMVLSDWRELGNAPSEVQADRSVVSAALTPSCGLALGLAGKMLRKDKQLVLRAVQLGARALQFADESLKSNRAFVTEAVALRGEALEYASAELRASQELVLKACAKGCGSALKGASESLRSSQHFVLKCAMADIRAVKYASDEVRNDKGFAMTIVRKNGGALQYMAPKFKADADVVSAALKSDPTAIAFAHTCVRQELGVELPQDSAPKLAALKKEQDEEGEADVEEDGVGPRTRRKAPEDFIGPFWPNEGLDLPDVVKKRHAAHPLQRKTMRVVHFSAASTILPNMGQANYVAANSFLDKLPCYERPVMDSISLMWGPVGNVGMRWKAFASADMLNANPEALLDIDDARNVLEITLLAEFGPSKVLRGEPETCACICFDEATRSNVLRQRAAAVTGVNVPKGAGKKRGEKRSRAKKGQLAIAGETEECGVVPWESTEEETSARLDAAPLGSWPELSGSEQEQEAAGGLRRHQQQQQQQQQEQLLPEPGLELAEGCKVLFKGLQSKTGVTGTLLQRFSNGRWKVSMDDGTGNAVLRVDYLIPLAVAPPAA